MLTETECERIAGAVRDAEGRTAGEIVVVVAARSSGYRSIALLYALLGALVTPWPLIWATSFSVSRIAMVQLGIALALTLILSQPKLRFALVPNAVKRARCRELAARQFAARGLARTQGRAGVLLFASAAERYAEVVADEGIAALVDEHAWRDIIAELVESIRDGRAADGIILAVRRIGQILAEHVPSHDEGADELPNKVILI
jgi:putative membrane protein